MNKAKVLSVFPGVGKTYLFNNQEKYNIRVADSDSSQFSWIEKGVRNPDFPANYIAHIKENLEKFDLILVSSHEIVRKALREAGIKYDVIVPNISDKDCYIQRFRNRGSDESFIQLLSENWEKWISDIHILEPIEITVSTMTYRAYLSDLFHIKESGAQKMLKTVLFTHDDLDGAGCSVIFKLAHQHLKPEEFKIIHCANGTVDKKVQELWFLELIGPETTICFGDICPSKEFLEKIVKSFPDLHIWDHHKTNLFAQEIYPKAYIIPVDVDGRLLSGTSIMYRYFTGLARSTMGVDKRGDFIRKSSNPNVLYDFIDTIRSYDTYEWKKTNNVRAKQLQIQFQLLGMQRFVDKYTVRLSNAIADTSILHSWDLEYIDAKLEQEQNLIDDISIKNVRVVSIKEFKAAVMITEMNVSEIAYQFLQKYPEIDIFIGISLERNQYQFRTIRNDLDTGALIAKPAGGGGHPKASGCPIPNGLNREILDMLLYHIDPDSFEGIQKL